MSRQITPFETRFVPTAHAHAEARALQASIEAERRLVEEAEDKLIEEISRAKGTRDPDALSLAIVTAEAADVVGDTVVEAKQFVVVLQVGLEAARRVCLCVYHMISQ